MLSAPGVGTFYASSGQPQMQPYPIFNPINRANDVVGLFLVIAVFSFILILVIWEYVANTLSYIYTAVFPPVPKYIGCYPEPQKRILDSGGNAATLSQCNTLAKAAGVNYFGMQNYVSPGMAKCYYSSTNAPLNNIVSYTGAPNGLSSNLSTCTVKDNIQFGNEYVNALYSVT
jgi:hypothetical protein